MFQEQNVCSAQTCRWCQRSSSLSHLTPWVAVIFSLESLVAQCSATPASVAATPPCSATPLQRQLDVRHSWLFKGDRCDRAFRGECSAILLLHLKKTQDSEEICCDTCSATGGPPTRVQRSDKWHVRQESRRKLQTKSQKIQTKMPSKVIAPSTRVP